MTKYFKVFLVLNSLFFISISFFAQEEKKEEKALSSCTFADMKLRGIGPAFMSGRIADIASILMMIISGILLLDWVEYGKL